MRQILLILVSVLLVTGSLTATLGTLHLRDFELRGYVDPTKDQNIPFTVSRAGVNVELFQYAADDLQDQLQRIQSAGFRWIRQFAYWSEIEQEQGEFGWKNWDRLAAAMADFPKPELVVVLMNSPAWAREERAADISIETAPPQDFSHFAAFANGFAARYGAWIDYYQIWDEPNLADAWGELDPRPAEYVALLAAAREAILQADPSATIIAAGLAPTTENRWPQYQRHSLS